MTDICGNCFSEAINEQGLCSVCGYDTGKNREAHPLALPAGTILCGRYIVGKVLGQGGFGITYLAQDYLTRELVAIKEFFPDTMATRTGRTNVTPFAGDRSEHFEYGRNTFLGEAKTMAEFIGNENVVQVRSYFEENNTGYFVMEYVNGTSLQTKVKQSYGRISWDEAVGLVLPVIDALALVHEKGIIHRDVTPDNIYIKNDGTVKLLDFGAARHSLGNVSRSLDVVLKHGFAPKEQYHRHGRQGPYTDVYSVAATIYYAITGTRPDDAIERLDEDNLPLPSTLGAKITISQEDVLLKGLAIKAEDRYQTMRQFGDALREVSHVVPIPVPVPVPEVIPAAAAVPVPEVPEVPGVPVRQESPEVTVAPVAVVAPVAAAVPEKTDTPEPETGSAEQTEQSTPEMPRTETPAVPVPPVAAEETPNQDAVPEAAAAAALTAAAAGHGATDSDTVETTAENAPGTEDEIPRTVAVGAAVGAAAAAPGTAAAAPGAGNAVPENTGAASEGTSPATEQREEQPPVVPPVPPVPPKKKKTGLIAGIAAGLLLVAGAAFWVLHPHSYGEWQVLREATCTAEGERERKCFCGDTETEVLTKLDHTVVMDEAVASTCAETGLTEGCHCSVCGTVLVKQTETPLLEHTIKTLAAVPPTCVDTGLTEGVGCINCGYFEVEPQVVEALGHTSETDAAVAATCTKEGKTEGAHCSVCGEVLKKQESTPKVDHTPTKVPAVAATCTANGKTEGSKCSVCGEILKKQESTPKVDHKPTKVAAVAATCTSTGLTEGSKCSVCGTVLKKQESTPKADHKPTKIAAVAATCTSTGLTEGSKCSVCGTVLKKQETTPKTDHKPTAIPAVSPTCTESGLSEGSKCSVCGKILKEQTKSGDPLGHGFSKNECSRCGLIEWYAVITPDKSVYSVGSSIYLSLAVYTNNPNAATVNCYLYAYAEATDGRTDSVQSDVATLPSGYTEYSDIGSMNTPCTLYISMYTEDGYYMGGCTVTIQ